MHDKPRRTAPVNADDEQPDRRELEGTPTVLVVEPTPVRGGRRSTRSAVMAAVGLTIFVGVALWKPWEGRPDGPGPSLRVTTVATPAATGDLAASSASPIPSAFPFPTGLIPFPSNAALLAATTRQPTWGVRAMVLRPGGPIFTGRVNLAERWVGVPPNTAQGSPALSALAIAQPDDDVAAIGVTTTDDALPLDVRFWRLPADGPPVRLAPIAIPGPEAGSWLWLPDPSYATVRATWPAGAYEIEALLGPRIVRLVVTIPNAAPATSPSRPPFVDQPIDSVLGGLGPGLFVLADGGGATLVGGQPPVADEREGWLGPSAGLPLVARVSSVDVTGFGAMLLAGQQPASIDVRQIAQRVSPLPIRVDAYTVGPENRRAIVGRAAAGLVPDGLYRVTVGWTEGADARSGSWSVEVVPSIQGSPPTSPLDAMSRWVGFLDHPDNHAGEPLVFIADAGRGTNTCSSSTTITGHDPFLGIVVPPRVEVVRLQMRPLNVIRSTDIAIRYAPNAIPRLTVVALPPGGLPARDYDIFLTLNSAAGETRIAQRICVSGP